MKKIKQLFLGFLAVVALSACRDEVAAPYPVPQAMAQKTLFVYMPWSASRTSESGSLYHAFQQNLTDIQTAIARNGGLGRNRLLVFISSSATSAVMMEVVYRGGICRQDTLERYSAAHMPAFTTADGIADILTRVKQTAPAQRYALIVGCHGTGWLFAGGRSRAQTRYFGGSEPYFQTNISALAQGIGKAGMKMQFVMFDDCYMSNVEVAYELRRATDHLIGCASEIMAYGMPYERIWKYLAQPEPDYQRVVDEFHRFYSAYSTPCGNIGVADCSQAQQMASVMKRINARHVFNLSDTVSVQKLDGYRNTIFFDFDSYVRKLCGSDPLYADFQTALSRFVPYKASTPQIYTSLGELPTRYINVGSFSGITISAPTVSTYERAIATKTQTAWWAATH